MYRILLRRLLMAGAASMLAGGAAAAQDRHELLEEDVEPLTRALRAKTAMVRWKVQRTPDPLAALERLVPFAFLPPGARYDAQCTLESPWRQWIFSLTDTNPPADARRKSITVTAQEREMDRQMEAMGLPSGATFGGFAARANQDLGPLGKYQDRMVARGAWYEANGFIDHPYSEMPIYLRNIGTRLRVSAYVEKGGNLDIVSCWKVGEPAIEIGLQQYDASRSKEYDPFTDTLLVQRLTHDEEAPQSEVEEAFAEALTEAGMTEEQFNQLLQAILVTRKLLGGPAHMREWGLAQASEVERERFEANAQWFRTHGGTIMPLLEELHRAYYHPGRSSAVRP